MKMINTKNAQCGYVLCSASILASNMMREKSYLGYPLIFISIFGVLLIIGAIFLFRKNKSLFHIKKYKPVVYDFIYIAISCIIVYALYSKLSGGFAFLTTVLVLAALSYFGLKLTKIASETTA